MKRYKNHRLTTLIIVCILAFSTSGLSQSAPYITTTYPESWGILHSLNNLSFTFNETVNEVAGKSIIIYNAGDQTPALTFTLPSASVTGTGTDSISVDLGSGLQPGNYYVNIDHGAFQNLSGIDFAGITDTETWKITILSGGIMHNSTTWSGNVAVYTDIIQYGVLTVSAGSSIKFMGHHSIEIYNDFHTEGTVTDSIFFFANNPATGWKGLRLSAQTTISYCKFENGKATGSYPNTFGGAIFIQYSPNIHIENSTFLNNYAEGQGGAIYCESANPIINNNVFKQNSTESGGAISVSTTSSCKIYNNLFIDNTASGLGGAILFEDGSNPQIYNNTFSQNQAQYGGAVSCIQGSSPTFKNCIFYQNQASQGGNEINVFFSSGSGNADIYYCLVEGGEAGINGNFTGDYEHCIDANPLFSGTGSDPYSLLINSPCIDAGDPGTTTAEVGNADLAGGLRFMFEYIDMGAYENSTTFDDFPGTALKYNGSSHYVSVDDNDKLDLTDNFTIEAWIKPESFNWLAGIVSKYQSSGAHGYTLRLTGNSPHSGIEFNGQSTPTGVLEAGQWYHIAAVRQGGTNYIYINGEEQALSGTSSTVAENNDPLCIGVDYLQSPRYFDGLVDEVRIWDVSRSRKEIRENMYLNLQGQGTGLVAYWQFNTGHGTTAYDGVGSANGTLHNMDDTDWLNATIPFGSGHSDARYMPSIGLVTFTDTDVSMYFPGTTGIIRTVVTRIDTTPDHGPENCDSVFSNQYWVINTYGQGQFTANVSFTVSEDLTAADESSPHKISLYKRQSNGGSEWEVSKVATSIDAASNTATFNGIDEFSQFIIGRYNDTIAPVISETYPESWGILQSLNHLEIQFDESVNEVAGKSIVIYNAHNHTPARTFTLPSTDVTGTDSPNISVQLSPSLAPGDYYVNIDAGAFQDPAQNDFAGIIDVDTWKISVLDNYTIWSNTIWSDKVAVYTNLTLNAKLTINPGTSVKFMGHYEFNNWGDLYAEGTESDSIRFYANDTAAGWKGIRVNGWVHFSYCRIENGNAITGNNDAGFGGAIYMNQIFNVVIEHCTFSNNYAEDEGGAIYSYSSDPVIRNCVFRNNSSDYAGAVAVDYQSNPKIENNLFINNSATEYGGAIFFAQYCNPHIYNNTFSQNSAGHGGAVSCIMGSRPVFSNCIFYGNTAVHGGNEVSLVYSTYTPGKPDFYYCNIEGGQEAFEGNYTGTYENNIDDNPIFIENGDHPFSLHKSSPCVNTGDPTTTTSEVGNTDLAGGPRFLHGQIDMGAYETTMTPDDFAGTALDFDGIDDYVDCGNNTSLDITDAITVEAWIKADAVTHNSPILQKGNIDWLYWDYSLESISGKGIQINLPGPNTGWWEFQYDMDYGKWYHVAWTFSQEGELTAYVNGEICRQGKFPGSILTNTDPLKMTPSENNKSYKGLLDEIRVWNVVRTRQEIRENMYLTFPENEPGMVSYWQFNSGEGNALADLMGVNRGKLANMNDDDWVNSTIPFGDGNSNTRIVSTTGTSLFPNTGIEMDFLQKSGTDTITVTKIDTLPNRLPSGGETMLDNSYWVINPFGDGTFNTNFTISFNQNFTTYDQENPSNLILFTRENTGDSSWSFFRRASSVDAQNNTATFDSIAGFGQFIVSKNEFDYYPGHALQFDTSAGYVTLANESHFDFDTAFTLETWLYLDSMSVDYHTIISKGNAWMLRLVYADDAIMLEFSINKGDQELAVTCLTDTATMLKKWNHISCVYHHEPPNYFINIYLNGVEGNSSPAESLIPNDEPVLIGSSFKGKLDELRFWRTLRSTQQIRESMHLTLDYPFDGLVSNFQLNEGEGTTVKDPFGGNFGSLTSFNPPAGWVQSGIPFGGGQSNTQIIGQPGTVVFSGTDIRMNFGWPSGDTITVSKIDTVPNINPAGIADVFDKQYWVVEPYGDGDFNADISFSPNENLTVNDMNHPGEIKLFYRNPNAATDWVLLDSADQVDLNTNEIRFDEINQTGQFIIGRKKPFSGYPGHALYFDGESDYVSGSGIDTSLSAFTIEAWIKHDTLPAEVQRYVMLEPEVAVIRYDGTIYGGYRQLHFYIKKANGHLYSIRVDSVLVSGEWLHVAGTYDGELMKLYLNGELLEIKNPATNLHKMDGNFEFSSPGGTMSGQMDEIRIWDFARTEQQIREGMHRVINMSEEGLVNYWQFNEGGGTTAADTVSGLVGTLYNMDENTCWKTSTIPAGMGVSNTQLVNSTGNVDFPMTGLTMDFTAKTGTDSITATKINISPNINQVGDFTAFDSQYWVVNSFGENNFTANLTFRVNETLEMNDEYFPSRIKLFSRTSNSDSSWVLLGNAYSVDVAESRITFDSIQHFSQFLIAREGNNSHSPGNCLYFDGIDDFVSIPPDTSLDNIEFTVEFWISTTNPAQWAGIIDKGRYSHTDWYFLTGSDGETEGVKFGIGLGTPSIVEESYSWNNSDWHHIAGTYDGSVMKLYVDGILKGTRTETMLNSTNAIHFGNHLSGGGNFVGKLDEVRIWNVALPETQIRERMHKALSGNESNLVSYWTFDESSGNIAHDLSSDNNGTLNNMTDNSWRQSTAPVPYFTLTNGDWESAGSWALGQNTPGHDWARTRIEHEINLNSSTQIMELIIKSKGVLTVLSGFTLIITPE